MVVVTDAGPQKKRLEDKNRRAAKETNSDDDVNGTEPFLELQKATND